MFAKFKSEELEASSEHNFHGVERPLSLRVLISQLKLSHELMKGRYECPKCLYSRFEKSGEFRGLAKNE
jgi:hypothetical protein